MFAGEINSSVFGVIACGRPVSGHAFCLSLKLKYLIAPGPRVSGGHAHKKRNGRGI